MSRCKGCGAEIIWKKTPMGKRMPVDPEPVWVLLGGGKPFLRADGSFLFGRKVGDAYDDNDPDSNVVQAYESHFATCLKADEFRKK